MDLILSEPIITIHFGWFQELPKDPYLESNYHFKYRVGKLQQIGASLNMEFYLDESGSTGGISQQSFENTYGGQKIFTLAAIGIATDIDKKIFPLLQRYKIQAKELKASKLYKRKPEFIVEVFKLIKDENWPIFIEAVDKKFMLTANIVNCLVLPGNCFKAETRETNYIRNVFVEYLYAYAPDEVYIHFLKLCTEPSANGLIDLIEEFIGALQNSKNDVSSAIIQSLSMTLDDVKESIIGKGEDISEFLPIPDTGKHGKTIWMLPNLSSFTNIYARINLFLKGDLSDVKIFHDEQLQFDDIIAKSKHDLESISPEGFGFISDSSDYKLNMSANLFFKASHDFLGIQFADLIAGYFRLYIEEIRTGEPIDASIRDAHKILMTMNHQEIGVGLNMVMSSTDTNRINI